MNGWNQLLNAATLGTDKSAPDSSALPETIRAGLPQTGEAEGDLLRQLAALSVYRRSGWLPLQTELSMPPASPEALPYCSRQAEAALSEVLALDNMALLTLWLRQCSAAAEIAPPDYLDRLLDIAGRHKALRSLVLHCGGHRAGWLCGFNPEWSFAAASGDEDVWRTGNPEQRRELLRGVRETEPAAAIRMLGESWSSEDAASKTAFLQIIAEAASAGDLSFLESLGGEKSKKVQEAVRTALQRIPGSPPVQLYWHAVQDAIQVRKEKSFLGLKSKEVLHVALPQPPDEVLFSSGIEKTSPIKGLSDEDFVLGQLVTSVPPSFWEEKLQLRIGDILAILQENSKGRLLLRGLAGAAARFRDKRWAEALAQDRFPFYSEIVPLLEGDTKETYLLRRFSEGADDAIPLLLANAGDSIWSEALATAFLAAAATEPYQYHRGFFSQHAQHLPSSVLDKLDGFKPAEAYYGGMWSSYAAHIRQLVGLRDSILQAFSSGK